MLIDLLPRTSSLFERYKTDVLVFLAVIVLPIIIVCISRVVIKRSQAEVESKLVSYQQEMASYQQLASKDKRIHHTDGYRAYVQATEKIWRMLAEMSERNVCITEVSRTKSKLTITGSAQSAIDLTYASDDLLITKLFASIRLHKLSRSGSRFAYQLHAFEKLASPLMREAI